MEHKRIHLIVRGRVQGVNFRWATQQEAGRRGLSGWVMNRPDGAVEIVAEGMETDLLVFRDWCGKGPPAARVSRVEATEESVQGTLPPFEIRYE